MKTIILLLLTTLSLLAEGRYQVITGSVLVNDTEVKPMIIKIDTQTGQCDELIVIRMTGDNKVGFEVKGWAPIPDSILEEVQRIDDIKKGKKP